MASMHEIDYKMFGDDMQYVEVELDPERSHRRRSRRHDVHGRRDRDGDDLR